MIIRQAQARLEALLRVFPVVLIVGPRQAGKTTLLRAALPDWSHYDLERSVDWAAVEGDPDGFLAANPRRVAIDEAQRLPALMPALRVAVDQDHRPGRFVLTGSSHPALMKSAGETLAGRIGVLEMTPLGLGELAGRPARRDRWFWGGYPRALALKRGPDRRDWLDAYISTFLERDIPALGIRIAAPRLRRFWTMLTHVHGGLWNASEIARSMNLNVHTVNHYLDLLEGALVVRRLPPFHANLGKRLTKSPKVYIRDTGLLHRLAGLRAPAELAAWPGRGASWEGLIVEELARLVGLKLPGAELYFWRTQAGGETDLLIKAGSKLAAVEIKAGSAPAAKSLKGLRQCMKDLSIRRGFVVYGGQERLQAGSGITFIGAGALEEALGAVA